MSTHLGPLDKLLGLRLEETGADRVVAVIPVTPDLYQQMGIVHGGVYAAAVEATASIGAAIWLGEAGWPVGIGNHTEFLRATRTGRLRVEANPVQRGHSTQLWRVEITDDAGRLVAHGEVRLMNIREPERLG